MASVLILSKHGDAVPVALKLVQEGHIVKIWFKEQKARPSLEGYRNPSKIGDPRKMLEQYDLVLSDMAGMGELCDELKEKGKLVLGGGVFNDKLELDREYGEKVAKNLLKVKIPETKSCDTVEELLAYLEKATNAQVVKPSGNKASTLVLVSNDKQNRALLSFVKTRGKEVVPCIVQERVEGIEISTEGWFNGKEWVKPFNHTMEKKRFMEGDKGPNIGCAGNVVWPTEVDKLVESTLMPLEPLLTKVNYVGPIDVNCIVNSEAYFLEFTPRLGYEAIQAWSELLKVSLFDYLYKVASGQTNEIAHQDEQAIAVRLSIPPYPSKEGIEECRGLQVLDVPNEAKKHVWLSDVMMQDNRDVLAGVDGVIGCVTARGQTVRECQRRAYRTINNIVIHQDVQYRSDIGSDVEQKVKELKGLGWLNA